MDDKEKKGWIDGVWHGDSDDKEPPQADEPVSHLRSLFSWIFWLLCVLIAIPLILYVIAWYKALPDMLDFFIN